MKLLTTLAFAACAAAKLITLDPITSKGEPIAIVWVHGALCDNAAYEDIAKEVQKQGAQKGQRIWVGLPDFASGSPDPITLPGKVKSTLDQLRKEGFTGNNVVMAGHSLGGVMAQGYTKDHSSDVKAQVLMGSVLTRDNRSINRDGTTQINYKVPTMAIGGSKDGLMRLSRVAESYWHTNENINSSQSKLFPTIAFEGVSHAQFLSGKAPYNVRQSDLKPDVSLTSAHQMTANAMVEFFDQIILGHKQTLDISASHKVLKPMLDAMELEGYYETKPPCDNSPYLVNPNDRKCLHGSPWNMQYSQKTMGGDLPSRSMKISSNDNFHPVDEVNPVHLPEVDNDCAASSKNCTLKMITVTQNYYDDYDKMDTGFHPQAASEMKSKMSSRQQVQTHAGVKNPDFSKLDESGNRCADINNESIKWAYNNLSKQARQNYDRYGVKLVTGDDLGPYNEGPLWIWTLMKYAKSKDGKNMVVSSPMMRTPTDYLVKSARGFHYCKVLSPFKAMEWMMLDGLYDHNGIKNSSEAELMEMLEDPSEMNALLFLQ